MKLFISGTTEFDRFATSSKLLKIKKLLDRSKLGELFTSYQIAEFAKVHMNNLYREARTLAQYTHKVGSKRYWGRPETIKQLIKETK